ncbi:MAG: hypothetical protein GX621_18850 [Pirellulaceae bacterium]|nr:hypothetical protein [Pirellulaceae bacterium]
MVNWQDFSLSSVQTTMFTPDHSAFAGSRVVATILRQYGERFSGDMQVLPPDFPPQITRVVLASQDGTQKVNAGPARFDYLWEVGANGSATLREAIDQCVEVLQYYVRETKVGVGRLALVAKRVCPNEDPPQTLIRRFCNESSWREPFNRSATFEIHNHKEYSPVVEGVSYRINSWVRCQCGVAEPEKRPTIVVTQDLNTTVDELGRRRFSADEVAAFYAMASNEAEEILKKYFPLDDRDVNDG